MAEERERQGEEAGKGPATGSAAGGGPERYPQVRQDEAIERAPGETARSFAPDSGAAGRRETPSDSSGATRQDGFFGPQGDPADGKP